LATSSPIVRSEENQSPFAIGGQPRTGYHTWNTLFQRMAA
jgi:hypothetical protein